MTWPARAPAAWMNIYYMYPHFYVYRASEEPDRIGTWIVLKATHKVSSAIFKYGKAVMLQ